MTKAAEALEWIDGDQASKGDPEKPFYELTRDQQSALHNLVADATHVALGGGSRSGKTFLFCRQIILRALRAEESRHLISRFRFNVCKTAIGMDTLPKVFRMCFPDMPDPVDMLDKTDWFYLLPNGSEIWITGLDDDKRVEKVLGHEYATMFFNECSQIPWKSVETALTRLAQKTETLELKAYYDLNPPSKKHWTYMRFIEKLDPDTRRPVVNEFDYSYLTMNPEGNAANLDPKYLQQLRQLGERARNRFLHGRFADDSEGALWTEETLTQNRVLGQEGTLPQWLRIVIGVDPSGTKGPEDLRSDEVGIVVVALGTDGHGYVIEDLTVKARPEEWADIINSAYDRHLVDRVVAEKNYGGDMVRAVLQAKNPNLPYLEVVATRGKEIRAEPISALYDAGRVHHIGYFPEMEDEMQAMLVSGYTGLRSPNRLDALVWALTELFPKMTRKDDKPSIPPKINVAPRSSRSHAHVGESKIKINTSGRSRRRI